LNGRVSCVIEHRGAALLWRLDPDLGLLMVLILPPDAGPERQRAVNQ
jgi:hypothetical protein